MDFMQRFRRLDPPPPPAIDHDELREEMAQDDPDFVRVREVHHDALQAIGSISMADGLAIRREREFWSRQRHPEGHPNGGQQSC